MKYRFEHDFRATLDEMEAGILNDPELFPTLARSCAGIDDCRLLRQTERGAVVEREVAYTPHGKIPAFAERWITREMVSWVEVSRYDRARHRFDYEIRPNIPPGWRDRFSSAGSYQLRDAGGGTVARVIDGEIVVKAMLVGGIAERFLVAEVRRNFDQEARAIQGFLDDRRARTQEGGS